MKRVTTGAYIASAMVRSPNRNGPPDLERHSRQMVQMRSMSPCARDQILKFGKCPFRLTGFTTLRASLPVNLKGHFPGFKIWSRAQADIDRVCTIWRECLAMSGGPFLFGQRSMADAMYAPVVTRFMTYDVKLEPRLKEYADMIMALPEMQEWIEAAKAEPADIEELEVEY